MSGGAIFSEPADHDVTEKAGVPAVTDDIDAGFRVGDIIIDISASPREGYKCTDNSVGAAIWEKTTTAGEAAAPLIHAATHLDGASDELDATLLKNFPFLTGFFVFSRSEPPGINDDSASDWSIGDMWFDTAGDVIYVAIDVSVGAAVWRGFSGLLAAADSVTTALITDNAVTNAKAANMGPNTIKGHDGAGGDPDDLTATEVTAMLNVLTSALKGLAPASGGGTTNFLRADATWAPPTQFATGTFTGDGSTSQAITGVGFQPGYVAIWNRETGDGNQIEKIESTSTIVDDNAAGGAVDIKNAAFATNAIISLDADGFTVDDGGGDEHPNASGQVYNFMAIG